jgi:prepilin-type N-terminal cleavage/methylation domain-containing protein/prepilin-type processing-associated H-X9-DG protein
MSNKKAFTLIELLVVIAIIALLLSIIMPSLRKTKKQAQFIICKTNLKNYGMAGTMYIQNNNDCFPNAYTWLHKDGEDGNQIDPCAWHDKEYVADGIMWPYLEAGDVHMCPTFYRWAKVEKCTSPQHNDNIPVDPQYSYSMNSYLGHGKWFSPEKIKKISEIKRPAEILFFSEENLWDIPGRSWTHLNNNNLHMRPYSGREYLYNNIATYHKIKGNDRDSGVANIAFADGHVDSGSNKDGYELATPRSIRD